ncbi:unnamed protein product [Symbiodinium microadriaticum]|nr:unnamed protein product [Symbiodinium microadriaticum]
MKSGFELLAVHWQFPSYRVLTVSNFALAGDFTAVDCGQRRGAASSGHFKSIGLPVQRNVVPAAKASQVVYASSCAPQTSKYSTSTMAAAAIFDFTLRFNVAAEVQPARGNGCALRTDMPIARQQHAPSLNTGVMRITDSMVRCGLDTVAQWPGCRESSASVYPKRSV